MKKIFLIVIVFNLATSSFAQSHISNVEIGLFKNGSHGSNKFSGAEIELALRIKPGGLGYTMVTAAEDFIIFLAVPRSGFNGTETINVVQKNASIFGSGNTRAYGVLDIGDPAYYYLPFVLDASAGISLNGLDSKTNEWTFAFTLSVTPFRNCDHFMVIGQENNSLLSSYYGSKTYSTLLMSGINQLTATAGVDLRKDYNLSPINQVKPTLLKIDNISPNPAKAVMNLMAGSPIKDKVSIQVFDLHGNKLIQQSLNVEAGKNNLTVNVSALANGTYIVKIISSTGDTSTTKFVKQ